ncbi:hypothetical protein KAX97_13575, partial [candidate division WOR-3 bacterium]|nr:hypothetical protein [candidate division WOR-3 bacterium]
EVLNLCNRFILPYGKALVNAGAFSIMVLEPQVVIFSPSIYKTMIQTYLEGLIRDFANPVLHVCGNTTKLLPHFAQMNHLSGLSLDALVDFKTSLDNHEQLRDKVLIGNIDPVNVMFRGSPEIVQDKVTELLNMMIGQNFILSTGCDMVPDTPAGNLDSLINAALKYR